MKVALSPLYLSVEEVRFVFQERSEFPRVFLKNNFTVYPCGRGEMLKTKAFVLEIKMDPAVGFHNPSVKTYLEKKNFFIMADIIYISIQFWQFLIIYFEVFWSVLPAEISRQKHK